MQLGEVKSKDTVKVPMADWKTLIRFTIRPRVYSNLTIKRHYKIVKKDKWNLYIVAEESEIETTWCY